MPFFVDAFPVLPATEQKRQTWYNGAKLPPGKAGVWIGTRRMGVLCADDGENENMKKEWTEQDLRSLVQTAQAAFETVTLTEEQPGDGWQDAGLHVDYELRNGRVDCVLRRHVEADGKCFELQMSAPLAGNVLPEERMTPRERELCRDDLSHDFLPGR